jgi:transposase
VASSKRGLKHGLFDKERTVILMLDEIIVLETPPLYSCYGRCGEQKGIPITGSHARRIVHGAINIETGDIELLITKTWTHITHQDFLQVIRRHWRGWQIVLFEDQGTPHTAEDSREYAASLGIQVRFLPRATPELNAMDHLWRHSKAPALANRPTLSIDASALALCHYIIDLSPAERLRKAGVLSGNFWLTD